MCPKCQQKVILHRQTLPDWVPMCYHTLEAAVRQRGGMKMVEVVIDASTNLGLPDMRASEDHETAGTAMRSLPISRSGEAGVNDGKDGDSQ